ncbi:MAG: LEA type 2 family protein [Candidatus Thermoplasmatota archaeon]|nr:LEA type 2 family protein [Candidatus Thermoplasmatota archaeon]
MEVVLGHSNQYPFRRGACLRQRHHVVAAVDRYHRVPAPQEASGEHAAELAEADDDDFINRFGRAQRFDVGLRVANPNDFDLTIEALEFELEVNGRPFAQSLSRTATLIPAASSTVLRVDAIMQSRNLIQQIRTLPPETLKDGVPYRIKGRVKTDRSSHWLPFDHSGRYGGDAQKPGGRAI